MPQGMRTRARILASLEATYRQAFERAQAEGDRDGQLRLDFEYQRDQIQLEVLLDIRDLLSVADSPAEEEDPSLLQEGTALVEKAQALRRIGRLR